MAMKKTLFAIIICVISGCRPTINDTIIRTLDNRCATNENCVVSLKEITHFEWEKMYIFRDWTPSDTIENNLGFHYTGEDVPDDKTRIIFIDGNKITHEEDFGSIDNSKSTVSFTKILDKHDGTVCYSRENAIFKAKKIKADNFCKKCFYYLLE